MKEEEEAGISEDSYQLPDGSTVEFGVEKFHYAELMFNPSKYEFDYISDLDPLGFKYTQVSSFVGIPKLASDAVLRFSLLVFCSQ